MREKAEKKENCYTAMCDMSNKTLEFKINSSHVIICHPSFFCFSFFFLILCCRLRRRTPRHRRPVLSHKQDLPRERPNLVHKYSPLPPSLRLYFVFIHYVPPPPGFFLKIEEDFWAPEQHRGCPLPLPYLACSQTRQLVSGFIVANPR